MPFPWQATRLFRERAVELDKTALLVVDLQKGEYNENKRKQTPGDAYLWTRLEEVVVPNCQRLAGRVSRGRRGGHLYGGRMSNPGRP